MVHPSWIERSLLLIALAASMALFWVRFRKVALIIRGAKSSPDFHLYPLRPRITQFLWEVLLQAKVIRQRPLPGLAHAFVFWGFCAFALITLNHLAAGFVGPVLTTDTRFGRFYF